MRTLPARSRPYYYGWNIIGICVAAQMMILGIAMSCFSLFVPLWSSEMNASPSELMLSLTLVSFSGLIFTPLAGWLVDRYPVNWLIATGSLIMAMGYAAISFATSAVVITAVYMLCISSAMSIGTTIPSQAVVLRWFERRRGLAMGLNASGMVVPGIVFPPLVVYLLPTIGWQNIWLLFAVANGVLMAPLAFFALYDRPPEDDQFGYVGQTMQESATPTMTWAVIIRRRNLWIITTSFLAVLATIVCIIPNSTSVVLSHALDMQTAGLILSVISITSLGGTVLFGFITDKLGSKNALLLVALIAAMGAWAFGRADSELTLYLAAILVGLSGGLWTVLPAAIAAEVGSANFGRVFSLVSTTVPVAMTTIPLFARVKEQTGSYDGGFLALAVLALLGAGIALMLNTAEAGGDKQIGVNRDLDPGVSRS